MINKNITKNIFKILHRELTMSSGDRWEIRYLKILGLLAIFTDEICFALTVSNFLNLNIALFEVRKIQEKPCRI